VKRRRVAWTILSLAAVAALGVVTVELSAGPEQHQHGKALAEAKTPAAAGEAAHAQRHHRLRAHLSDALKAVDAAAKAVDSGQKKLALAELDKARKLLVAAHKIVPAPKPALQYANARCPIMGTAINPAKVTAKLTRVHNGMKVAFCCGGCPAAWDKLTDAEKDAKLTEAMPITNARCPIMGTAINPAKVTAKLTRVHNGRTVGFCCGGCPAAWDKLTDAEKDAKLTGAVPIGDGRQS
jgi:hypothetical protein